MTTDETTELRAELDATRKFALDLLGFARDPVGEAALEDPRSASGAGVDLIWHARELLQTIWEFDSNPDWWRNDDD